MNNLPALEAFDLHLSFDEYNCFNCHKIGGILEVEESLARSLPDFIALSETDRAAVRAQVGSDLAAKLGAFGLRMASIGLQERKASYLRSGVIAFALDRDVLDPRDVYVILATLSDAAMRISSPLDDTIKQVSRCCTTQRAKIMIDGFLSGPDYMRSLTSMGVELQCFGSEEVYIMHLF